MISHPTVVVSAPDSDEFTQLAQLAFASRHSVMLQSQARGLAFLPPDALDMDLTDPMQRDFGDYELREKIGQGGMGVVYRAHQKSLDREVALKLLAAGPWASSLFVERFRREAQSAARLEHPNIVAVFEAGTHHDLHYFSMRLVRGESLATRLQHGGSMPPREAVQVLRVVADAVDFAHRLGVLHLDLKPGNVLLDEHGEPMVADFGLARRLDHALAEDGEDVSGTPAYMAPEQATGNTQQFGRSTDIYGLGSILYEMLCGRPPFLAATPQATLELVARGNPTPLRELRRDVPADLQAICLKCLAKSAEQRYATATALAEDLRRFLDDRPVSVRNPPVLERVMRWVRREPRLAAAGGTIALVLAGGLAATAQQWQRAESTAAASQRLLWEGRREAALTLAMEGKGLEAVPRLLDNLVEQEQIGALDEAAIERVRLGLLQAQGATLIDRTLVADANPLAVALDEPGRQLALAFNDLTVRWYNVSDLRERGRVSLAGLPTSDGETRVPLLVEFLSPSRVRVRLEWYNVLAHPHQGDSWLIDLPSASVLLPPAEFAGFLESIHSPDGSQALLRDAAGGIEYWRGDPLKPAGSLLHGAGEVVSWRLDRNGRYAFGLGVGMRPLSLHDLSGATPPRILDLADEVGVSAWSQSSDGRLLALGDFGGRVFLLDLASGAWRHLPATRSREVTWLSFSEDDAWLASASYDGRVHLFETDSGDPIAANEMTVDFTPLRVGLSRSQRLLLVAGEGQTALWRLPRAGLRAGHAQRVGLSPAPHELAGRYPVAWSLQAGLLASAGMDGQVRLWRLPPAASSETRGGRPHMESLHASGELELEVHWNRLRVLKRGGDNHGRWLELPQPPAFAALLDGGSLLVMSTGAELRTYKTASLSPLYPPVALPSTPQRVEASADGRSVLLSFGVRGESGLAESLRLFDARTGQWYPGAIELPGQIRHFAFSHDLERILVVGPRLDATRVLQRADLTLLAEFPHDPFEPVVAADFYGSQVALALRADDRRMGSDQVLLWDPQRDEITRRTELGPAMPRAMLASDERLLVAGETFDLLIDPHGNPRRLARLARSETTYALAASPDGRLLARGFRSEVQLHDARTGDLLGMVLPGQLEALDFINQIGFTADGNVLLANSTQGHRLRWPINAETRSASELMRGLRPLLQPESGKGRVELPNIAERRALRARDPGSWPEPVSALSIAFAPGVAPERTMPARSQALPDWMLDLASVYAIGPYETANMYWNFRPGVHVMPHGLIRVGEVDFDVRGIAQLLRAAATGPTPGFSSRLTCLSLPPQRAAAVHLLVGTGLPTPASKGTLLANLTLRYLDGTHAKVSMHAGSELPGYVDDREVPLLFASDPASYRSGASDQDHLSAPRLPNPHPERTLRCLDLELARERLVLALYAITLEPAGHSGPVIVAR